MRRLNKSVLAGGVVYPAGTPATPELAEIIVNPRHWDGDGTEDTDAASAGLAVRGELRDVIERIASRHLEDPTLAVADLLRTELGDVRLEPDDRVARGLAMLAAAEAAVGTDAAVEIGGFRIEACDDQGQTTTTRLLAEAQSVAAMSVASPESVTPGLVAPYGTATPAALKAEVDRRNADRDPAGETFLAVADRRSKDQLVAALQADDAAQED